MRRITILVFALTAMLFTAGKKKEDDNRTRYFPKYELKAEQIPEKKNVWVFLLAGQSNMAGRAFIEPQDTIPNERVLTINMNNEIIIAKEPVHIYQPTLNGLGCGLSFGKTLLEFIPDSVSILLLPTAVGGSSISQWIEDSVFRNISLLSNFEEKVEIGKQYGQIKGVLWHQGERDANKNAYDKYKVRLNVLFGLFRQITCNDRLPILIGELGSFSGKDSWDRINQQIHAYALEDSLVRVISTSDLKDTGDKVHFDSESQRILGIRFANTYKKEFMH